MWQVFRAMILVVLKNDLELTTMLMLIITICTATSTQTNTSGNFLICYAFLSAKNFMWIFSLSLFFFFKVYTLNAGVCACSVMSDSVMPQTVAHQAPLSMEFSRQGYWSGLPFPTTEDFPYSGIKPTSPVSPALASRFCTTEPVH